MGVEEHWTLDGALEVIRGLEKLAAKRGFHLALAGGVLQRGKSEHDIDVILFPDCTAIPGDYAGFKKDLAAAGWGMTHNSAQMIAHWKTKGGLDRKHVEVFRNKSGKRMDLIYVGKAA